MVERVSTAGQLHTLLSRPASCGQHPTARSRHCVLAGGGTFVYSRWVLKGVRKGHARAGVHTERTLQRVQSFDGLRRMGGGECRTGLFSAERDVIAGDAHAHGLRLGKRRRLRITSVTRIFDTDDPDETPARNRLCIDSAQQNILWHRLRRLDART